MFLPGLAKRIAVTMFLRPFKFGLPPREVPMAQKAKTHQFSFNGKVVHLYHWGNIENGYVLCMHGWSGRAMQFFAIIDHLQTLGLGVVAFDAPAHGNSEGKQTNIIEFADCIDQTTKIFGKPKALIGHSLGGISAMLYQVKYDSKTPTITINSPAILDEIFANYAVRINGKKQQVEKWLITYVRDVTGMEFYEFSGECLSTKMPNAPFLICIDKDDKEVSIANAQLMHKNIAGAELFITEGLGHVRILRANNLLERVADFIKKVSKEEMASTNE